MLKKCFENFEKFTGRQASSLQLCQNKGLTQVFCCEFGKIFMNSFFTEHLRRTYSVHRMNDQVYQVISILRSSISPENTKKRCDGAFLRTKLTPQSVFLGGIFIFAKEIEIGIIFCSATVLLSVFSLNLCWLIGNPFTHSCIVLRNCQTCFKNFAVFTL